MQFDIEMCWVLLSNSCDSMLLPKRSGCTQCFKVCETASQACKYVILSLLQVFAQTIDTFALIHCQDLPKTLASQIPLYQYTWENLNSDTMSTSVYQYSLVLNVHIRMNIDIFNPMTFNQWLTATLYIFQYLIVPGLSLTCQSCMEKIQQMAGKWAKRRSMATETRFEMSRISNN